MSGIHPVFGNSGKGIIQIFGIDPGVTVAGVVTAYCTKHNFEAIRHYLAMNREGSWLERSIGICDTMKKWISDNTSEPEFVIAIEEPMFPMGKGAFARMGAANTQNRFIGILLAKLNVMYNNVYFVNATSMKKIFTGNGRADKDDIVVRANDYYNHHHRTEAGRQCIADSLGIAYACWKYLKHPEIKGVKKLE